MNSFQNDVLQGILKRVRRLELKAQRLSQESFSGAYHSSFKGQGLDFDDFREYLPGDETRFIDWKVTARMGTPYIRKFHETRERVVVFAVDVSASTDYGSQFLSKREYMAEVVALLGFSALRTGDKVGLLLFGGDTEFFIPPAKGTKQILRIVREILAARAQNFASDFEGTSSMLARVLRRRAFIFLVSDFLFPKIESGLRLLSKQHEIIGLRIDDPAEKNLPNVGPVVLKDPETGHFLEVKTQLPVVQKSFQERVQAQHQFISQTMKKYRIDFTELSTDSDYLPALHALFRQRSRRFFA